MDVSLSLFSVMLKLISEVKKLRDFDHSFEDLVPLVEEIDKLLKRLDRGNKHLSFLHKTMGRATEMVHKCSRVWKYNFFKKHSYTKQIKEINADFEKFCKLYMPLIQLLDQLRSRSPTTLNMSVNSNISTGRAWLDEDEQFAAALQESLNMQDSPPGLEDVQRVILESFKDKVKGKQDQEDEQFAATLQESLNMEESPPGLEAEQRVILESFKDKVKEKQVQDQENEQVAAALQESLNMEERSSRQAIQKSISLRQREEQVAKRRARELEKDEQIANALLYDESERITNGSSSSTRAPLNEDDVQRMIWESFKK